MLEFRHISFSYPGGIDALTDVSFRIDACDRTGLLGLNGSGKSTVLLLADALLFPDSGRVLIDGREVIPRAADELRRRVGMVFQDSDDQLFMPTVEADVAFGPRNMGLPEDEVEQRTVEALTTVGCLDLRKRQPFTLSGGQKKMVALATVLAMRPSVLLLDEPTSSLDFAARSRFTDIIQHLDTPFLLSTHDMALFHTLCNKAIVLQNGERIYEGSASDTPYPY